MEPSEKIVYHATHAGIHLHEILDMKLPGVSLATTILFEETAELLDGLAKVHTK